MAALQNEIVTYVQDVRYVNPRSHQEEHAGKSQQVDIMEIIAFSKNNAGGAHVINQSLEWVVLHRPIPTCFQLRLSEDCLGCTVVNLVCAESLPRE